MMDKNEIRIATFFAGFLVVGFFGLLMIYDKGERDCFRDHPEIISDGSHMAPCTAKVESNCFRDHPEITWNGTSSCTSQLGQQ